MPAKKSKRSKKSYLIAGRRYSSSQVGMISAGLIVLALVVFKIFASGLDTPTAPDQLVLSYALPHTHPMAPNQLTAFRPPNLLLYGDGRLLCGDENNSANTTKLKSGKLTSAQISGIVSQLSSAGFLQAKSMYASGTGLQPLESMTTILLNLNSGPKQVSYVNGAKPQVMIDAEKIMQSTCALATSVYQPDSATIVTKKVSATPSPLKLWDATKLLFPSIKDGQTTKVSGSDLTKAIIMFGGLSKATFQQGGNKYELAFYPTIPIYKQPVVKPETSVAHATGSNGIRYIWFYAADQSPDGSSGIISSLGSGITSWYNGQVGLTSNYTGATTYRGSQPASYYTTCHESGGCSGIDYAVWRNVYNELGQSNVSTNVITQFVGDNGTNYCEGLGNGGDGGGIAVTLNGNGYGCTANNYNGDYVVPAHEMGHSFGLAHVNPPDGTVMDGDTGGACNGTWQGCQLNRNQASTLASGTYFSGSYNGGGGSGGGSGGGGNASVSCNTGSTPCGFLDETDCNLLSGWSADNDDPNHTSGNSGRIDIYIDGPTGSGAQGWSAGPATKYRSDVGYHAFSISPPGQYLNGQYHTVYAYNFDYSSGAPHQITFDGPGGPSDHGTFGPCSPSGGGTGVTPPPPPPTYPPPPPSSGGGSGSQPSQICQIFGVYLRTVSPGYCSYYGDNSTVTTPSTAVPLTVGSGAQAPALFCQYFGATGAWYTNIWKGGCANQGWVLPPSTYTR